jgi:uncharacterized protein
MRTHIERTEAIIAAILAWAVAQNTIRAIALVGSRARGTATPDSDIDLILLVVDPESFRVDQSWSDAINGLRQTTSRDAQYGDLWSRHVRLDDGIEVEFGFASLSWASRSPLNTGAKQVISNGCRVLYDPDALLATLLNC